MFESSLDKVKNRYRSTNNLFIRMNEWMNVISANDRIVLIQSHKTNKYGKRSNDAVL